MITIRYSTFFIVFLLATIAFATDEGGETPEGDAHSPALNAEAAPQTPSWTLDVQQEETQSTDEQAVYVIKARLDENSTDPHTIRQLNLWWTTPSGVQIPFELNDFDDGIWVSRLAAAPERGLHGLLLVAIAGKDKEGIESVWEDGYQLEVPSLALEHVSQRQITGRESGVSPVLGDLEPTKAGEMPQKGASIALITLMIGLINVLVLALLGGVHLLMSHLPHSLNRLLSHVQETAPISEKIHEIFEKGRLFESYEEVTIITETDSEQTVATGGKLMGILDKVLSKDEDAEAVDEEALKKDESVDDIEINLNDLSF